MGHDYCLIGPWKGHLRMFGRPMTSSVKWSVGSSASRGLFLVLRRIFVFSFVSLMSLQSSFAGISEYITAQSQHLPFPKAIELKVEFWKAIYTKYSVNQGIIHDSEDLSVVYDAVQLPKHNEMGAVDRVRHEIREAIFNILRKQGQNLTTYERQLLAKFPAGVTRARLMRATENIRFQRGQADRFKEGIIRSGYYLKYIEQILKEEGVPDFVKFLPHVESSFQEYAISKFEAAGLWQLMPSTGRLFLRVEYVIDERLDPWIATRAAARHLKRDFKLLGAWPLAVTAYNHGPGGVLKAVKTLGTSDIADIAFNYESPSFGFASRNFYAQFLAAVEVASNYQRYFGELPIRKPLEFDIAPIERPVFLNDFAKKYEFNMDEFKRLNPGLRQPILQNKRPIPVGLIIRVPPNSKRQLLVASLDKNVGKSLRSVPKISVSSEIKASVSEKELAKKALAASAATITTSRYAPRDVADGRGWIQVEINETVTQVADWLKVPVEQVREWNGMDSQGQIQQGQRILLKFTSSSVADFQQSREDYHKQIREDFFSRYDIAKTTDYKVKRGENLWSLCYQKFDIPPWLLAEYNPKVDLSKIAPGISLKIPVLLEKEFIAVSAAPEAGALAE